MAGAAQGGNTQAPNFNQLAAQSMQGAMGATQAGMANTAQGMNFYSPMYAGAYMNPYQQNVIGGLRQNAMQNYQAGVNQLGAEATRAGAFGGSRHGVAQGVMAGDVQNQLNQQIGQLRYQGYNDALNRAAQDQQMRMGASSQLTGQAQALSGIGNQMYNMSRQANLDMQQAGLQQQAIQQAIIDAAKGQYAGYTGAPTQALGYLTQALGGAAGMVPQSTVQSKQPGLFDYLTMAAVARGN